MPGVFHATARCTLSRTRHWIVHHNVTIKFYGIIPPWLPYRCCWNTVAYLPFVTRICRISATTIVLAFTPGRTRGNTLTVATLLLARVSPFSVCAFISAPPVRLTRACYRFFVFLLHAFYIPTNLPHLPRRTFRSVAGTGFRFCMVRHLHVSVNYHHSRAALHATARMNTVAGCTTGFNALALACAIPSATSAAGSCAVADALRSYTARYTLRTLPRSANTSSTAQLLLYRWRVSLRCMFSVRGAPAALWVKQPNSHLVFFHVPFLTILFVLPFFTCAGTTPTRASCRILPGYSPFVMDAGSRLLHCCSWIRLVSFAPTRLVGSPASFTKRAAGWFSRFAPRQTRMGRSRRYKPAFIPPRRTIAHCFTVRDSACLPAAPAARS